MFIVGISTNYIKKVTTIHLSETQDGKTSASITLPVVTEGKTGDRVRFLAGMLKDRLSLDVDHAYKKEADVVWPSL